MQSPPLATECLDTPHAFRELLNARLPQVLARLHQVLLGNPEDPARIEQFVRLDPVLAAQVLRHSQEPPALVGRAPLTLEEASARLGHEALLSLCEPAASQETGWNWSNEWPRVSGLLEHTLAVASAAKAVMRERDPSRANEAYLAGLLHDLGRFCMLERHQDEYVEFCNNPQLGLEREQELFGESHESWGAKIAEAWNVPAPFAEVMGGHHDGANNEDAELIRIVRAAEILATRAGVSFCIRPEGAGGDRELQSLGISARLRERIVDSIFDFLREATRTFGINYTGPGDLSRWFSVVDPLPEQRRTRRQTVAHTVRLMRKVETLQSEGELGLWLRKATLTRTSFERAFVLLYQNKEDLYREVLSAGERRTRRPVHIPSEWLSDELGGETNPRGFLRMKRDKCSDPRLLDALHSDDVNLIPLYAGGVEAVGVLVCDRRYSGNPPLRRDLCFLEVLARAVGQEIERRRLIVRLEIYREDAERDYLTGIYNRRSTIQFLEREIVRAQRTHTPLGLIMLDIDNFKSFNDIYGHLAGDVVLREVSRLLQETARLSDVVGRYGGEEFLIVLPDTPVENAYLFAERLRNVVMQYGQDKLHQYPENPPTISIGVSWVVPERDTADDAIERVDRALYGSKKGGRNRVCLEPAEPSPESDEKQP